MGEHTGSRAELQEYDVFLSYARPDEEWVESLEQELTGLGLRVFRDRTGLQAGDNWVVKLSEALECSRYLVVVLSEHTAKRRWVLEEVSGFLAQADSHARVLQLQRGSVAPLSILRHRQVLDATDGDVVRASAEVFGYVGDASTLAPDDTRRFILGRDLVFTLAREDDKLRVTPPHGVARIVDLTWIANDRFGISLSEFSKLQSTSIVDDAARADLHRHARVVGDALFAALFDDADAARLDQEIGPDGARPALHVHSDDDLLLSLPWELLLKDESYLVRDSRIDLVRSTVEQVAHATLLREPKEQFKLVVNVSAPTDSRLNYEEESYRITLATADRCRVVPTELGTVDDLKQTVLDEEPAGIHFSGHGQPGGLVFEDEEGREREVGVGGLIQDLRAKLPAERSLPPFFYLASCHGNAPVSPSDEEPGASSAAVQLHRAGVTEVVGYFGPIVDELSTRAEESLYEAIAEGRHTRDAVNRARQRLARAFHDPEARHRPAETRGGDAVVATHPFAWAQLVYYHRGPEFPLSIGAPRGKRGLSKALERRFEGFAGRRVLRAGFIGRRRDLHQIRKRLRRGDRVLVLQGLGGLGKSTLAQEVLPWLADKPDDICTLWCQEVEGEENLAEGLVRQLLGYCRRRFGLNWESVVQQVDVAAGDDSAKRFTLYLQVLVQHAPGVVLYLDNLESLLVGPDDAGSEAFGAWANDHLAQLWANAAAIAEQSKRLYLVASCRYRNDSFRDALMPVPPLSSDALFRLTDWFPSLQRMSRLSRARLVDRLDGHPRAVEYANDLLTDALARRRDTHGEWQLPSPPAPEDLEREWTELVAPCLPKVESQLVDNLLLQAIWDNVLDERAQRFLYRMTVLRQPVVWRLLLLLGDPEDTEEQTEAVAAGLRTTSLLEQSELPFAEDTTTVRMATHYSIHPATERFVNAQCSEPERLRAAHARLGTQLEADIARVPEITYVLEAGYHLLEARLPDRSYELLGGAADWLMQRGQVRESLATLVPFLGEEVQGQMNRQLVERLFGTMGIAYHSLGEVQEAINFHEKALIISREINDGLGEGNILGNLGLAYARLGDVQKAIDFYEQALVIRREIGDRRGEGNNLGNLGSAYADLGDVQKAISFYEQTLVIRREIGDRHGEGGNLGNLGSAYAELGEMQKAIGFYEQALAIRREIGDRRGEATDLGNLGSTYARLGDVQKAIALYEQALVISREIGDRHGKGRILGNLGLAYTRLGDVQKAIGFHEQHLVIAREIGDRRGEGNALGNLGLTYARLGETQKAIELLAQAAAIGREVGDPRILEPTEAALAELQKNKGE